MYMDRRRFWAMVVALVTSTALLTYGVTTVFSGGLASLRGGGLALGPEARIPKSSFERLQHVYGELKTKYVDPEKASDEKLVTGAIEGMVKALGDPYTVYLPPVELGEMTRHFEEEFSGIGVRVEAKDKYVTVVSPMKGTPGEKAGLLPGDKIVKVDGKDIVGAAVEEAVRLIRGPKGTTVKLEVLREGRSEPLAFEIVRANITVPSVEFKMLEPGIGYVRLIEFKEKIARRLVDDIEALRRQGARGLIVDLRQNPGGLLDEAVDVSELFVPSGPVVHVVSRDGEKTTYTSRSRGLNMPFVVLVDGFSASASEIVAGAVQDRGAAPLVGTRTFGKGSVQQILRLPDGSGLKLTTSKYLTPNGRSIHGTGITPDIVVELPKDEKAAHPQNLDDPSNVQLRKAIEVLKSRM